ncbi:hypothetical protein [Vibrio agarivorans]|uniref:Uncharacterized protein n=1 Tax=Vibrio agarivorans TaxID=153622 RepID=A0ABT7Y6Z8_9VIBR|nr:hypothetical protein [Vibrio agarivorans]MDN2483836.1 hypothetical protein [Vibrio agarivorans]
MPLPFLELYRNSIYCNPAKQTSRPTNWFSTTVRTESSNGYEQSKFRWVNIEPIAFEVSYKSAHSPCVDTWNGETKEQMRHNHDAFPFGVMTFREDNTEYWRNCAKNYLIDYRLHFTIHRYWKAKIKAFLSSNQSSAVPDHWSEYKNDALSGMKQAQNQFRQCRAMEKANFGLINPRDLPTCIKQSLFAITRLNVYLKRIPHNQLLAYQSVERFYAEGFMQLKKRLMLSGYDMQPVMTSDCTLQKQTLTAYLTEKATAPKFVYDNKGTISEVKLDLHVESAAAHKLSFGASDTLRTLSPFKKMCIKYGDIADASKWFAHLSH